MNLSVESRHDHAGRLRACLIAGLGALLCRSSWSIFRRLIVIAMPSGYGGFDRAEKPLYLGGMIIDHPKRTEILTDLGNRCRSAGIPYYHLELLPDREFGWDARFKTAIPTRQAGWELTFLRIVQAMRDEYGPR